MESLEPFTPRRLGEKAWGNEWLVAELPFGIMKRLEMNAGYGGDLQHHEVKWESFHLHSGKVNVRYVEDGHLIQVEMTPGQTFQVPPGATHQVTAVEDSILYELSNPVYGDRVSDADRYKVTASS